MANDPRRFVFPVLILHWFASLAFTQQTSEWQPETAALLFMSSRDGNAEIYLSQPPPGNLVNLTSHPSGDNWPVWSPDGTQIAFQSDRSGNLDIWVMGADGSNPRQLTHNKTPDYLPSWSPDGKSISFTSRRKSAEGDAELPYIYIMNADGSDQRRLVADSLGTSAGAEWSPDGRRIVYSRKVGDQKGVDIFMADSNGQNERRITKDADQAIYNGSPMFSPDGKRIAFYSDNGMASSIVVMRADGTKRNVVVAEGQNWYPRWSPDGRWLVYTAAVRMGENENIDVFAIRASGQGKPILLAGGAKREQEGSWRPN